MFDDILKVITSFEEVFPITFSLPFSFFFLSHIFLFVYFPLTISFFLSLQTITI